VQEKPGNSASVIAIETEDTPQGMLTIARQLFAPTSSLSTSIRVSRHVRLAIALIFGVVALTAYCAAFNFIFYESSLAVAVAIFASATMSSVAGFAFSAICGAFLFHILGKPVRIVEIMIICSISIQLMSVFTLRNAVEWRSLWRFVIGGIGGLPIGLYLLTHVSPSAYLKCMGVGLVLYGFYMLTRRPFTIARVNAMGDCAVGFLGGISGGFAGFPGAFVTIWCGLKGWSKDRQRGAYQPFILIMQILALASLVILQSSHAHAFEFDAVALSYVPAALLGTWCGLAIFQRLTDMQFARFVNLLLVVSGVGLIW